MPLYFLTCVFLFWVPGVALLLYRWRWLDRFQRKGFWIVCAIMAVVTFAMEYVYLWADVWSFSEAYDPLLGIELWGAPIEEFTFWLGATPFVLGVYWVMQRFDRSRVAAPRRVRRRRTRRRKL